MLWYVAVCLASAMALAVFELWAVSRRWPLGTWGAIAVTLGVAFTASLWTFVVFVVWSTVGPVFPKAGIASLVVVLTSLIANLGAALVLFVRAPSFLSSRWLLASGGLLWLFFWVLGTFE